MVGAQAPLRPTCARGAHSGRKDARPAEKGSSGAARRERAAAAPRADGMALLQLLLALPLAAAAAAAAACVSLVLALRLSGGYGADVALFHPFTDHGGGGERVMWVALKALMERHPEVRAAAGHDRPATLAVAHSAAKKGGP